MKGQSINVESYFPAEHKNLDWKHLIKRREWVLNHIEGVPPYLLLPEIHSILCNAQDPDLHFFINTIWHIGARISEALELTPSHFNIDDPAISYASIKTFKKRTAEGKKRPVRAVPIYDHNYKSELMSYCYSKGIARNEVLFPFVRGTYNKKLERLQDKLTNKNLIYPVKLTPHVFRHSFAIHCLLNRILLNDIQRYLGHKHISETEIYTRIFTGETDVYMSAVQF